MRIVLQRVSRASVIPHGTDDSAIQVGVVLLVGFTEGDQGVDLVKAADKICNCRIFPNESGKLDKNIKEIEGGILVVPQFTLYAQTGRGRRPDFTAALEPGSASELFDRYVDALKSSGLRVVTGVFGADMAVDLVNNGPLTLIFDYHAP